MLIEGARTEKITKTKPSEKEETIRQAKLLGDFLEKVVPTRIAAGIIEDYKRELKKGVSDITKKRYDNPEEYEKAVRDVSNKISKVFKAAEEQIARRAENRSRGEALVNKIELRDVFEGRDVEFALKEGDVANKEYRNMLKFKEFLPDNLPKVYYYTRLGKDGLLVMEKIEGKTLKSLSKDDIDAALKANPKLFFDLGRITAVMNNNAFVHGDLYNWDNIMLSKDNVWKIIDFEFSRHFEKQSKAIVAQTFFVDINKIRMDIFSDKLENKQIKNDFYEGYLLNRNLKEFIPFISKGDLEEISKILKNISTPSKETRDYFNSLINETDRRLERPEKDEVETEISERKTKTLKDF